MESWISSFSLRSRPCRNSFRASSEEVVTGILPAALGSVFAASGLLLVLSATLVQPVSAAVAAATRASKRSMNLLRDIVFSFECSRRVNVSRSLGLRVPGRSNQETKLQMIACTKCALRLIRLKRHLRGNNFDRCIAIKNAAKDTQEKCY